MSIVEEKYNELAILAAIKKVEAGQISEYTVSFYEACKKYKPNFDEHCTLEQFAARTANWRPGQAGIGEDAQIEAIKIVHPDFKGLNNSDKGSIFLYNDNGQMIVRKHSKKISKTNIKGTKTFNGMNTLKDIIELYFLKTIDIGKFSKSTGGGHQNNVRDEIIKLLENIVNKSFTFDNKPVHFVIMIDGRSAPDYIKDCKPLIHPNDNIRIGTFEDLFGDKL